MRIDAPIDCVGRSLSITTPIVFAKRTGLCGVFPGIHVGRSSAWPKPGTHTWKKKHFTFFNAYVFKHAIVHCSEKHSTFVLVEPLLRDNVRCALLLMPITNLRLVDMIVLPLVWTSDGHDNEIPALVEAEVIYRRLKEPFVFVEPFWKVDWGQ